MPKASVALLWLSLAASCTRYDPQPYLAQELGYVQLGVQLASEEKEVRRVFSQRGLRVVGRLENDAFIALGAASRDGQKSAVRVVSRRGVVVADDASQDDLFAPGRVALIEHFGGTLGENLLVAHARIGHGRDVGCVTLHRVLPDGSVVQCPLDVAQLGSRACVSNLAPGHSGHMQAKVAWPDLHALTTPQIDVELAFFEPRVGEDPGRIPVAHIVPGPWLDREATRLSTLRLSRADFSQRHAAGVARAAVALLTGKDVSTQVDAYRNAVSNVLPGSPEAEVLSETASHIQRGWLDAAPPAPERVDQAPELQPGDQVIGAPEAASSQPAGAESVPADAELIEPDDVAP